METSAPMGGPSWNPVFLGLWPAVPLFLSTASFQRADTAPLDCLRTCPGPCYSKQGQKQGWQIKTKCKSSPSNCWRKSPLLAPRDLEPHSQSVSLPAPHPRHDPKACLQGCWGEGKLLGHDWDSLAGDQAGSQMKFFTARSKAMDSWKAWVPGSNPFYNS